MAPKNIKTSKKKRDMPIPTIEGSPTRNGSQSSRRSRTTNTPSTNNNSQPPPSRAGSTTSTLGSNISPQSGLRRSARVSAKPSQQPTSQQQPKRQHPSRPQRQLPKEPPQRQPPKNSPPKRPTPKRSQNVASATPKRKLADIQEESDDELDSAEPPPRRRRVIRSAIPDSEDELSSLEPASQTGRVARSTSRSINPGRINPASSAGESRTVIPNAANPIAPPRRPNQANQALNPQDRIAAAYEIIGEVLHNTTAERDHLRAQMHAGQGNLNTANGSQGAMAAVTTERDNLRAQINNQNAQLGAIAVDNFQLRSEVNGLRRRLRGQDAASSASQGDQKTASQIDAPASDQGDSASHPQDNEGTASQPPATTQASVQGQTGSNEACQRECERLQAELDNAEARIRSLEEVGNPEPNDDGESRPGPEECQRECARLQAALDAAEARNRALVEVGSRQAENAGRTNQNNGNETDDEGEITNRSQMNRLRRDRDNLASRVQDLEGQLATALNRIRALEAENKTIKREKKESEKSRNNLMNTIESKDRLIKRLDNKIKERTEMYVAALGKQKLQVLEDPEWKPPPPDPEYEMIGMNNEAKVRVALMETFEDPTPKDPVKTAWYDNWVCENAIPDKHPRDKQSNDDFTDKEYKEGNLTWSINLDRTRGIIRDRHGRMVPETDPRIKNLPPGKFNVDWEILEQERKAKETTKEKRLPVAEIRAKAAEEWESMWKAAMDAKAEGLTDEEAVERAIQKQAWINRGGRTMSEELADVMAEEAEEEEEEDFFSDEEEEDDDDDDVQSTGNDDNNVQQDTGNNDDDGQQNTSENNNNNSGNQDNGNNDQRNNNTVTTIPDNQDEEI